jgi:hypothetical protein
MATLDPGSLSRKRKRERRRLENGPYTLVSLIDEVPLSAEGDDAQIKINCVEFLGKLDSNKSHQYPAN